MRQAAAVWAPGALRIAMMACLLAAGTVLVRNCTDVLCGMAHGLPAAAAPAQPAR